LFEQASKLDVANEDPGSAANVLATSAFSDDSWKNFHVESRRRLIGSSDACVS
jgi:hypothetical protein